MRLSTRILSGYFIVIGLMAAFILKIVVDQIKPSVRQTIEEVMVDTAHLLAELATHEIAKPTFNQGSFASAVKRYEQRHIKATIWHFEKQTLDFDIYVTDARGIVIFDSSEKNEGANFAAWQNIARTLKGQYGARSTRYSPTDDSSAVFHVTAPIFDEADGAQLLGTLTVAKPIDSLDPIISQAKHTIFKQALGLFSVALAIGLAIVWRLNRSIARLVKFADLASRGQIATAPVMHTHEFAQLANAMDSMRTELAGKRQVEQYAQGLAHELKSPLSALAASGELLSEPNVSTQDRARLVQIHAQQIDKMKTSIDLMLSAAKLENHQPVWSQVAVEKLCIGVVQQMQAQALVNKNQVIYSGNSHSSKRPTVMIKADAGLVELALSNLINNAIGFSPQGGLIEVSIAIKDALEISVSDSGPGIAPYALPRVTERFYSLPRPNGEKGSGLGLSIVQFVAQTHAGRLELVNQNPGLKASLVLPLA
jgi:two-component system, OmpR family, sensor histidine kinase CreC